MKNFILCLYWIAVFGSLLACHSTSQVVDISPSCTVANPLQELSWLKAIVADTVATRNQYVNIYQATYKTRIVYLVDITPGPDAGVTTLYDCQGTIICKGYTTIAGLQSDCKGVFNETQVGPLLYKR